MTSSTTSERRRRITPLVEFLQTEAGGGALLFVATVIALVWANSGFSETYHHLWETHVQIGPESWKLDLDLHTWVNDALMAVFFFLIGLEIKRELVVGELRDPRAALLPAVAAVGGMALPALIYLALSGGGEATRGWGVPMATDIAFAVGVLALLGTRAPVGLKLFLLTLAIVDDLGAILVIALFYSTNVGVLWLLGVAGLLAVVVFIRRIGAASPLAYVPVGALAWYATYRAGIHPTIAGVALGLLTPAVPVKGRSVLEELEHRLHPWSSYVIVPIFALANAGVDVGNNLGDTLTSRVTLAVAIGLIVGKTLGITLATFGALATKATRLPSGVDRAHVLGAGALGGIGFTVALFIASLAFDDPALETQAKIGILLGSISSGIIGATIIVLSHKRAGARATASASASG
ncbi:MAG TPA: Na+/H+ antiporter NhaA [Acidimicrobiales bacterium]|jgi:Na+:H+ antiporter, NhaA family|nr:Na+/H+ antiporter NhaA [Acidimicrobiales bacterium]